MSKEDLDKLLGAGVNGGVIEADVPPGANAQIYFKSYGAGLEQKGLVIENSSLVKRKCSYRVRRREDA
jgi:hypothetical protein